jgi:hypothetical protein
MRLRRARRAGQPCAGARRAGADGDGGNGARAGGRLESLPRGGALGLQLRGECRGARARARGDGRRGGRGSGARGVVQPQGDLGGEGQEREDERCPSKPRVVEPRPRPVLLLGVLVVKACPSSR